MKNIFVYLLISLLAISCSLTKSKQIEYAPSTQHSKVKFSPEDFVGYGLLEAKTERITKEDIHGIWKLTMWSAFVVLHHNDDEPIPMPEECGIQWNIDADRLMISITKEITASENDYSRDPGMYSFEIDPSGYIIIDGEEYGFGLDKNKLILDSNLDARIADGGVFIQLEKIEEVTLQK